MMDAIAQADADRIGTRLENEHEKADGVRIAKDQFTDAMAFFHLVVGRTQALDAIEQISRTFRLSQLAEFKASKGYRALKGKKLRTGSEFSGKWADFCTECLHQSVDTVDNEIANFKLFGEAAVESMQRMGIGPRKFAELRRLPEDDKAALAEAAEVSDKDNFLDLAEAMIIKSAAEKQVLEERLNKKDAEIEILHQEKQDIEKLSAKKNVQMDALAKENIQLHGHSIPWDKCVGQLKNEMGMVSNDLDQGFGTLLLMHQVILDVDFANEDDRDVARRSLVLRYKEVLDRSAILVAELQHKYDTELCGYIGALSEYHMQDPDDDSRDQDNNTMVVQ